MRLVKAIKDPGAFELLVDETRRRIVFLGSVQEMTVNQVWYEGDAGKRIRRHLLRSSRETRRNDATCQPMP